jgi:4-hydroxythreonine-4-phosphate dehydrogenase
MGDPAGIGPELCLRLLAETRLHPWCIPLIFGDLRVLRAVADACGLPEPTVTLSLDQFEAAPRAIHESAVVDFDQLALADFTPGTINASAGRSAFTFIKTAIRLALRRSVDAICTGPIHKESLAAAGVPYPGHTEILAALTDSPRHCMMLTSPEITCSLVTAHVGLREVPSLLNVRRILDVIDLTARAMRRLRSREPRLTVCGLNPHAGEHGLFGNAEEERFIAPAVQEARVRGITIEGPLPPDTAFLPPRRAWTDAYVCMYHDQGLIPLKMLAFDEAVNVTLGLPIIRTSVDHGTAFDIAWQGKASPTSLFEAVRLAARLAGAPMDEHSLVV